MKITCDAKLRMLTREIARDLVRLQGQAADVGLYVTMNALNDAAKKLGWEVAGKITKQPILVHPPKRRTGK
ncbi:MAG: hypothetical protein A2W83_03070 [Sulfuricurvum sp. RIFCSPLOWO2_12_43_5]|nr:MAG: hypothetical protein A2W83_03070 [Sulfuricurvum sp. RIFCSPLOWO2_12_43_5]